MKKQLTLLICAITCSLPVLAQGIYFKAGGGYGVPMASQVIGEKYVRKDVYDGNNYSSSNKVENITGSYGAGTNFLVGGGFMFNEYLGVELNVQYTMGKKFETGDIYTYNNQGEVTKDNDVYSNFSNAVFFNPAIVVTPGAGTKVPYGRFGIIAGSPKVKEEQSYFYNMDGTNTRSSTWEYTKNLAFGFQGAVGMNWMINDKIDLFTEVNFISMTYYPGEANLTEQTYDGNDNMPEYEYYKKTIYKDEIDVQSEPDINKPREELKVAKAFSSLSFQVGITFSLNGHGEN